MTESLGLYTTNQHPIALQGVRASVKIHNLLSEVTLKQHYKNTEAVVIEAVYTFSLPKNAVLLSITMDINGRQLTGSVTPRAQAEAAYEDAITDGDSAMLLNKHDNGLYTINLGNLEENDEVTIILGYAELLEWHSDQIRFFLPTVIGERYGNVEQTSLRHHEQPVSNSLIEHAFSLDVTLSGAVARAQLTCPTHAIMTAYNDDSVQLSFASDSVFLDRDFILNMHRSVFMDQTQTLMSCEDPYDDNAFVQLASFQPVIGSSDITNPIDLKIVVDCSGSMTGDSITQARDALHAIMEQLTRDDSFSIVRFGSSTELFSRKMCVANEKNKAQAKSFISKTTACLGGTEMEQALAATYQLKTLRDRTTNVLLITDGEVWDEDHIVNGARTSAHRLFTVGVGSAVSETLVRDLAEVTGGASEFVTPNENMPERITRHFQRIRCPAAQAQFNWNNRAGEQSPSTITRTFPVDTLHVFQRRAATLSDQLFITYTKDTGSQSTQTIAASARPEYFSPSVIARLAANAKLNELKDEEQSTALAVQYQLMTQYTAFSIVDVREQKSEDLPELRQVPQMRAAGWGGFGSVLHCYNQPMAINAPDTSCSYLDIPSFLRRTVVEDVAVATFKDIPLALTPYEFAKQVTTQIEEYNDLEQWTIDSLGTLGLNQDVIEWLDGLITIPQLEHAIVVCFVYELMNTLQGKSFNRQAARVIVKTYKLLCMAGFDPTAIQERLVNVSESDWHIDDSQSY
jgi:Ca-activated chloride channel homolog